MEKREAWNSARALLGSEDDTRLRHAALELRRCLEAIVYEKLWAYRDRMPAEVARRWQPPQAFKALLLFEPDAHRTKTIRIAPQLGAGVPPISEFKPLGTDHRFESGWLTREYNKLGNLLHAAWPFARNPGSWDPAQIRSDLASLTSELERFVTNTFTGTFGPVVSFSCIECETTLKLNADAVASVDQLECLNPSCQALYSVVQDGDRTWFELRRSVLKCERCGVDVVFPHHRLAVGYESTCSGCSAAYRVIERYTVERVDSNDSTPADPGGDA